jgi:hypothetical protein
VGTEDIKSVADPLYDNWLDIFQTSFPISEQMKVAEINKLLRTQDTPQPTGDRFFVALSETNEVVAMAMYEVGLADNLGALWYMAVPGALRSNGIGSAAYEEITSRIFSDSSTPALLFEVEDPSFEGVEDAALAEKRIEFYRRKGALLIGGIHYMQHVGWQPPIPMHLMIQPRPGTSVDGESAFTLAMKIFEVSLERTGEIVLS